MNRNIFLYLPQINPSHINVNKTFIGRFDLLTRVFMNTFILSHNYRINSTLYIYTNYKSNGLIIELNNKFIFYIKKILRSGVINEKLIIELIKKILNYKLGYSTDKPSYIGIDKKMHKIDGYEVYKQNGIIDDIFLNKLLPDENINVVLKLIEDGEYNNISILKYLTNIKKNINPMNIVVLLGGRDDVDPNIIDKITEYITKKEHKKYNKYITVKFGNRHYLASSIAFLINFILDKID